MKKIFRVVVLLGLLMGVSFAQDFSESEDQGSLGEVTSGFVQEGGGDHQGESEPSTPPAGELPGPVEEELPEPEETLTGAVPWIRISEIFPRDTSLFGEYIVLEVERGFSGLLRIVGAGNGSAEKSDTVTLETGQRLVITDRPEYIVLQPGEVLLSFSSITLTDGGEFLEVWIGDQLHDKVIYSSSSVTQANYRGGTHNSNGYRVFSLFQTPSVHSSFAVNSPPGTGQLPPSTGSTIGTGPTIPDIPQDIGPSPGSVPFRLEEIYPYDTIFPEYVELLALETYNGQVTIQGLGQGTASKTFTLQTIPGIRRIITDNPSAFGGYPFVIGLSSISLTNNGQKLTVLRENGQQIDSVVYLGQGEGYSSVFAEEREDETGSMVRYFDYREGPSPGYTLTMIQHHFSEETGVPVCGIKRQHTKPIYATNKVNLQAMVAGVGIAGTNNTYTCTRYFSGSDETTFSGCNPGFMGFDPGVRPILLEITKGDDPFCSVQHEINLPVPREDTKGNYYQELYKKRKERFDFLAKQIRADGYTVAADGTLKLKATKRVETTENLLSPEDMLMIGTGPPKIQIHSVLPDPKGKDAGFEQMVIENLTDEDMLTDTISLARGKTSKGLPLGILLPPGEKILIQGDLGLVNKPTCFQLRVKRKTDVLGRFCYGQPKEGETITGGLVGFERPEVQQQLLDVSLRLDNEQACVSLGDEQILCKALPYPTDQAKQRKADARKLISTTKKVDTLQEKYDLWRKRYATLSANNKKREAALAQRNRDLRTDISVEKKQKNLFRSFYYLLRRQIAAEWSPIFQSPAMHSLESLYDTLVFFTESDSMEVGPIRMGVDDVQKRYDFFAKGVLPEQHIERDDITTYLQTTLHDLQKTIDRE